MQPAVRDRVPDVRHPPHRRIQHRHPSTPLLLCAAAAAAAAAGAEAPSLTFYAEARGTEALRAQLSGHPVKRLPESALPCVTLVVNGVEIPALLDTGKTER